jgi:hypothetical protein
MSEQDAITAYVNGEIGPWALYRRLVKTGVSVGAALSLVLMLPAVVRGDQAALEDLASRSTQTQSDDSFEVQRLLAMVAHALVPAVRDGDINPLAVSVAKLGVNVDVAPGERVPLLFTFNVGRIPLSLTGNLANLGARDEERNMNLVLNGNLGNVPINLAGNVQAPLAHTPGVNVNLGNANLDFVGNAGNVPLNFSGNIGDVTTGSPGAG